MALTHHIWGEQARGKGFSTLYLGQLTRVCPALTQLTGAAGAGMAAAMDHVAPFHPGPALLAAEATVHYGPVPRGLGGHDLPPGSLLLADDCFLLRTRSGYGYFYRKGEGVLVERDPGADPAEESLWLNGSVYAAIAAINGFLPFHASAVAWQGRVYAFSGPSGAGKSTLVAALGQHGLPLFCDDTLVLDVSDPANVLCLPGHKRLKLSAQALALTGAAGQEKVAPLVEKFYAEPAGGIMSAVLPLARLTFIEQGEALEFTLISGAQRLAMLNDDHYTAELYAWAQSDGLTKQFARSAAIAGQIAMQRLTRPFGPAHFAEVTAAVAQQIQQEPQP